MLQNRQNYLHQKCPKNGKPTKHMVIKGIANFPDWQTLTGMIRIPDTLLPETGNNQKTIFLFIQFSFVISIMPVVLSILN